MKVLRAIKHYSQFKRGAVAAIGNFDGVHLGHQHLLNSLREQASLRDLPLLVIIFEPQSREYFMQADSPPRISPLRDKLSTLQKCGVDYVLCLRFNKQLACVSAEDFAERILFQSLNIKYLLVGDDFKFGKNRAGNFELLKNLSSSYLSEVIRCNNYLLNQKRISSTAIRKSLLEADFKQASSLLGRRYSITAKVVKGAGLARKWGTPTANLNITQRKLSIKGVFCVQIKLKKGNILSGVANIGHRPTVDGKKQILEVHIFDFNQSIYGEFLEVFFLHKLRDEIKFASIDDLVARIKVDVDIAKQYFLTHAI